MSETNGTSTQPLISEMAIVDTFTKLIFGEQANYTPKELRIIDAFRAVESTVLHGSLLDMGSYLRNLGVREMIGLVAAVKHESQSVERISREGAAASATLLKSGVRLAPGMGAGSHLTH